MVRKYYFRLPNPPKLEVQCTSTPTTPKTSGPVPYGKLGTSENHSEKSVFSKLELITVVLNGRDQSALCAHSRIAVVDLHYILSVEKEYTRLLAYRCWL